MTNFNDRIERLAELEGKATPGKWWIDEHDGELYADPPNPAVQIVTGQDGDFIGELDSDNDQQLVCALRNEAMPLLREMQQALSEARAENERLREGIGRAVELMESKENLIEDDHPFSEWFYCVLGLLKDAN